MRKLLMFCLILTLAMPAFLSEAEESPINQLEDEDYAIARQVLDSISQDGILSGEPEDQLTRAEFIAEALKLFRISPAQVEGDGVYSDVAAGSAFYHEICTAHKLGWIDGSDEFYPDKTISLYEALKVLICASGYGVYNVGGGYPSGYLTIARRLELTNGIPADGDHDLAIVEAAKLFYNLLLADACEYDYAGQTYRSGTRSYMEQLYQIYITEGIISGLQHSFLMGAEEIGESGDIYINGNKLKINYDYGREERWLGRNVKAFCRDGKQSGEPEIVTMYLCRNIELTINSRSMTGVSETRAEYELDGGIRKISLDAAFTTIYNNRFVEKLDQSWLKSDSAEFLFVDNDRDGSYDICFVSEYKYGVAGSVDYPAKQIGFEKYGPVKAEDGTMDVTGGFTLDLNAEGYVSITKRGQNIELFELERGDVLALKCSEDGIWNELTVCTDRVSGTLNRLTNDTSEAFAEIDGTQYPLSGYFMERYQNTIQAGLTGSFVLGPTGNIIELASESGNFSYGYLAAKAEEGFERYLLKIFTENGEFAVYELKSRLKLDGITLSAQNAFARLDEGQVVRYRLNADMRVNAIDTAEPGGDETFDGDLENDNQLARYAVSKSANVYRSPIKSLQGLCSIASCKIFKVPVEPSDWEKYAIWNDTNLANGVGYDAAVYDIDSYGYARAMLLKSDDETGINRNTDSALVVELSTVVGGDGGTAGELYCWEKGRFVSYEIELDKMARVGAGDIVRLYAVDQRIKDLVVDFDRSEAAFVGNSGFSKAYAINSTTSLGYQAGGLYSAGGSMAYISSVGTPGSEKLGEYDYSFANLRNYPIDTSNIVLFNLGTEKARGLTASELRSFKSSGDQQQYVVIRQNGNFQASGVFVYEME